VRLLLEAGADATLKQQAGYAPLMLAALREEVEELCVLLGIDPQPYQAYEKAMTAAAAAGLLIRTITPPAFAIPLGKRYVHDLEAHNDDGDTALALALRHGSFVCARILFDVGAKVNERHRSKAFVIAASKKAKEVCELLIEVM
jgi:ankyrin repeat protein